MKRDSREERPSNTSDEREVSELEPRIKEGRNGDFQDEEMMEESGMRKRERESLKVVQSIKNTRFK